MVVIAWKGTGSWASLEPLLMQQTKYNLFFFCLKVRGRDIQRNGALSHPHVLHSQDWARPKLGDVPVAGTELWQVLSLLTGPATPYSSPLYPPSYTSTPVGCRSWKNEAQHPGGRIQEELAVSSPSHGGRIHWHPAVSEAKTGQGRVVGGLETDDLQPLNNSCVWDLGGEAMSALGS